MTARPDLDSDHLSFISSSQSSAHQPNDVAGYRWAPWGRNPQAATATLHPKLRTRHWGSCNSLDQRVCSVRGTSFVLTLVACG